MSSIPQSNKDLKARKARQARDRRAKKKERKVATGILKGLYPLAVQEAIARTGRSTVTTTKDGIVREYRFGAHVAAMVRQLLFWEGKGQANGGWIYKSAYDWEHSEAALTTSKLRTARRVGREEGLWEEREGLRPSDHRPVVHYRLNMRRVAQVVVKSELANTRDLLKREKREQHKERLGRKVRELETARADLGLLDEPETDNPQPELRTGQNDGSVMPIDKGNSRASEEETTGVAPDTPANLAGYPCQNSGLTVDHYSRFRLSGDSSGGAGSVAGDAPSAPTSKNRKKEVTELIAATASMWGKIPRGCEEEVL